MITVKKENGSTLEVNEDMLPHLEELGLKLVNESKPKPKPRGRKPKAEKLD